MTTTIEVINTIRDHGLSVADDSLKVIKPELYVPNAQGDLNILMLEALPATAVEAVPEAQLAPGTSRGSRHCIREADLPKVKFYRLENATVLHGPVLEFAGDVVIEHPEHGDQQYPAGLYAITYQQMHSAELKRMAD